MVIILNRGDFLLDTSDSDHYPRNSEAKTLVMVDGDEKVCFYLQTDEDESDEEENE
jgi:hypothetical protein